MRNITKIVVLVGAVALGAAVFLWQTGATGPTFADAEDTALVAQGEAVYAEQCASCHGARLQGQPNWRLRQSNGRLPAPPHDETGHTWHHSDAHLFQVTKFGTASVAGPSYKTDMAPFGGVLSDAEIWAVLAYIKSRWPSSVRQRHAEINNKRR